MSVYLEESTRYSVLDLDGALQAPVESDLRCRVTMLLDRGKVHIVLDLARLDDIDAAGVGELLRAYRAARTAGGDLRIAHPRPHVRPLLDLAGVLAILMGARERKAS